jgi:hypothetical protein
VCILDESESEEETLTWVGRGGGGGCAGQAVNGSSRGSAEGGKQYRHIQRGENRMR